MGSRLAWLALVGLCLLVAACTGGIDALFKDPWAEHADQRLRLTRPGGGILITRVRVITDGKEGSAYTLSPLQIYLGEFPKSGPAREQVADMITGIGLGMWQILTFSYEMTAWSRPPDGFLATWVPSAIYGRVGFGYPESAEVPPFPLPGGGFFFRPLTVCEGDVLYIGDIDVRQDYSLLGAIFHVTDMSFEVRDAYDDTVALFRERHPRFVDREVMRRVLEPMAPDQWRDLEVGAPQCPNGSPLEERPAVE